MDFLFFLLIISIIFLAVCFVFALYFLEKSKKFFVILMLGIMLCIFPFARYIFSSYKMLDIADTNVEIINYDLEEISGNYIYVNDEIMYEISNINDKLSCFNNNEEYQNQLIVTKTIVYRTIHILGLNIKTYTSDINYSLYLDDFAYQYMQYRNGERQIYEKK